MDMSICLSTCVEQNKSKQSKQSQRIACTFCKTKISNCQYNKIQHNTCISNKLNTYTQTLTKN